MHALLALVALTIDASFGYPQALFRAVGHPVSWIGRLIARCDAAWNLPSATFARRRRSGIVTVVVCLAVAVVAAGAFVALADSLLPSQLDVLLLGAVASSLVAQRSLYDHVTSVADALEQGGLEDGRRAVSHIVGRDTRALDEAGVSRAAIESLAENFSDGVVAPVFWLFVGGLPGMAAYKTINTADSMIGHKDERYLAFGWAAARLDDLVNLPASRLAALWLAGAAAILPGLRGDAWRTVLRDARHHRSPNAGWPEAAMAGALGVKLAGPRIYGGVLVPDHWMGDGSAAAGPHDIRRALRLYRAACVLQGLAIALVFWLTG